MSKKMRDEFESWCLENGYTLRPAETNCAIIIEGDYGHPTVQIAWQAWQASRAALVVELPAQWSNQCYDDEIMFSGQVIDAIDSAGVSYK